MKTFEDTAKHTKSTSSSKKGKKLAEDREKKSRDGLGVGEGGLDSPYSREGDDDDNSLKIRVKSTIKTKFQLVSLFVPFSNTIGELYEEKCAMRTADTIVTLCNTLRLTFSTLLTALVYLQLYKNASKRWRSTGQYSIVSKNKKRKRFLKKDEQFLTSAACVLLAWKYKEDDVRMAKSSKKLFDIITVLYKIIVNQSSKKNANVSVSVWVLQDGGEEIKRLKSHIVEHETQLLHAIDYYIGPVPLPHTLIPAYVKKFLICMTPEFVDFQKTAKKLEDVIGMLILDCYKTQMCIDYTPSEILVACILKASCLLSFHNEYSDLLGPDPNESDFALYIKRTEAKLRKFTSSLGNEVVVPERLSQCLLDIQKYTKLFEHNKLFRD